MLSTHSCVSLTFQNIILVLRKSAMETWLLSLWPCCEPPPSCFWLTTILVRLTPLNLRLSLSFTGLLLAVIYSSQALQTVSSDISNQTWKSSSDWKITWWSPQSNYAGLVYDPSARIHYPQLRRDEQAFNSSFQLAHHLPDQVVMCERFTFSFNYLCCILNC